MITRVRKIYLPALASVALLFGGTAMFAQGEANKKPEPVGGELLNVATIRGIFGFC